MDGRRNDPPNAEEGKPPAEPANDLLSESKQSGDRDLSPEEQMARFEEDLKANDWGHQPC